MPEGFGCRGRASAGRAGIDVISDGEFGKDISWAQYALFAARRLRAPAVQGRRQSLYPRRRPRRGLRSSTPSSMGATGSKPSRTRCALRRSNYTGQAELRRTSTTSKPPCKSVKVEEAFLPVAAPASVIPDRKNEYYANDDDLRGGDRPGDAHGIQDDRRCRLPGAARRRPRRRDL